MSERDQRIGKRVAIAAAGLTLLGLAVPLLVWATDLAILLRTGAEPNATDSGARAWERYNGLMPIVVPWWYFLLIALGWAGVLVMGWPRERRYFGVLARGRVIVFTAPLSTGMLTALTAFAALSSAAYFDPDPFGLYAVPAALLGAIAAVAFGRAIVNGRHDRRELDRRVRRRPSRKERR